MYAKESLMTSLGKDFVEVYNYRARVERFLTGKLTGRDSLQEIAQFSHNKSMGPQRKINSAKCTSINCLICAADGNPEWTQCSVCKGWKHNLCEGITETEFKHFRRPGARYTCLTCSDIDRDSWLDFISNKLSGISEHQDNLSVEYGQLKVECTQFKETAETAMGNFERELIESLDKISVQRQAYHSNSFVGNHCKKIVACHEKLCNVLPEEDPVRPKIVRLFCVFAKIQPLIYTRKVLEEAEIDELEGLCWSIGEFFPIDFPKASIKRKLHALIFDVPRFVRVHKTIGRYSEEEGESLHNQVNQELRRLNYLWSVRRSKEWWTGL